MDPASAAPLDSLHAKARSGPPTTPQPAAIDIFLSYSRANGVLMRRLESDLRTAGFTVWIHEGWSRGLLAGRPPSRKLSAKRPA